MIKGSVSHLPCTASGFLALKNAHILIAISDMFQTKLWSHKHHISPHHNLLNTLWWKSCVRSRCSRFYVKDKDTVMYCSSDLLTEICFEALLMAVDKKFFLTDRLLHTEQGVCRKRKINDTVNILPLNCPCKQIVPCKRL